MKTEACECSFQIIRNATIRGNSILIDSMGFGYHLYFKNKNGAMQWICCHKESKLR